jgi:hypothetical protein
MANRHLSAHVQTSVLPRPCCQLEIGKVLLSLQGTFPEHVFCARDLARFRAATDRDPDVTVVVSWAQFLGGSSGTSLFDSGSVWKLFREASDFVFDCRSQIRGPHPYKSMRVDQSFRHVNLILSRAALGHNAQIYPLEYPADELLVTNYLACHGIGVEVHGCGLVDQEMGAFLFLGHSETGKSTTARLWHCLRCPETLSDDRIILRFHDSELWMYGTPWHGDGGFASQNGAKVNRIFILRQALRNEIRQIAKARAVGEIFARSFPPFYSADGLERSVAFLHSVVERVPCYEFGFVPDSSAVEAALKFHE